MANKKFQKTEQAIFIAYYKFQDYPCVKKISKHAKISRSTFYRHHQNASDIPHDYEVFLLKAYDCQIKSFLKKNSSPKPAVLRLLVFISSNKTVIKALFKDGQKETIKKMLSHIRPLTTSNWRFASNSDKVYRVYENEILGVIESWGKNNFSSCKIDNTLNDILYLTKTAPERLAPLLEPEE